MPYTVYVHRKPVAVVEGNKAVVDAAAAMVIAPCMEAYGASLAGEAEEGPVKGYVFEMLHGSEDSVARAVKYCLVFALAVPVRVEARRGEGESVYRLARVGEAGVEEAEVEVEEL